MVMDDGDRATQTNDVLLRAEKITKVFPGTLALDKVDFNARSGKVTALVGENGAGKSTLMKIIAGVEQPTYGHLFLKGEEIRIRSPHEAASLGIGIIHQDLGLCPNLNAAENIFMGREITNGGGLMIDHKTQEERAREMLARLKQPIDPMRRVGDLRVGQQQIVAIAKALTQDMRIFIMDEPTSALTSEEIEILFQIIKALKAQGVCVVYISHKLDEVMEIGDWVTVLRNGQVMGESLVEDVDLPWIVERMVGREYLTESFYREERALGEEAASLTEVLRVKDLTLRREGGGYALDHVSFSLRAGEILGLYGLRGAGRTELLECIMGLHPRAQGEIWMDSQDIQSRGRTIGERIRLGLSLIPEDRQGEGVIPTLSVTKNMTLASLWNYLRAGLHIVKEKEDNSVARMAEELSIKMTDPQSLITSLSGGNQQKVIVGKGMLASPKILLMDEPTRGIDVGAKAEIYEIMNRLASQGLGIVFVPTEIKEILGIADRILVMSKGKITGEFGHDEATKEALVTAASVGYKLAGNRSQMKEDD
jgi:erythritol transport system ATP-binding protein